MTRRFMTLVAALAALALLAAGCGGQDEEGPANGEAGEPQQTAGFDGETIRLGVLTPLSGPLAVIGRPLTAGNEVFFESVNEQGGIAGRYEVEIERADTLYEPDRTVQQYNRIKNDVVAFTQVLGTAPTLAILPQLANDEILVAPASLDGIWVREENLLPVGSPYQVGAANAVDYYVNDADGQDDNICTLIQDDVYGEAGQAGVDFAAERLDIEVTETQRFRPGADDMSGQVSRLGGADCDMVLLVATPTDAGTILGTAAQGGFAPRWMLMSPAWADELVESPLRDYLVQNAWVVAEGTEWGDREVEGMAQMLDHVEQFRPGQEPDYYFAFGYNQGRAMAAVLERAVENGDLSREGIMQASTELSTVSFDGLTGDYTYGPADEREPPRESTIFEVDPEKPFGLGTLSYNHTSDAARDFEFEARE